MVRLIARQRAVLGEKVLDLATFAAAALVFSQFVGQQRVVWTVILAGGAAWIALASMAVWLIGERE